MLHVQFAIMAPDQRKTRRIQRRSPNEETDDADARHVPRVRHRRRRVCTGHTEEGRFQEGQQEKGRKKEGRDPQKRRQPLSCCFRSCWKELLERSCWEAA